MWGGFVVVVVIVGWLLHLFVGLCKQHGAVWFSSKEPEALS